LKQILTIPQGGGGRGGGRAQRQNWADLPRTNAKFEQFYNEQGFIPEEEKEEFWNALRRDLPNSFRFTGSRGYVIQKIFPADLTPRIGDEFYLY
jgi:multisite-specific tRNA:(cytosine-C5)-methyltransferase